MRILNCFFYVFFLIVSLPVLSQTLCAKGHGRVITGINQKQYCASPLQMNWWSAHAWCHSAGMELVNIEEDCDCTGYEECKFESACPNLSIGMTSGSQMWSSVPNGSSGAYMVNLNKGTIFAEGRRTGGATYRALCK